MKAIKNEHRNIVNILSFSLIPLSGFATDIYLPSLPSMGVSLHASPAQIQLSLLVFIVSAGISQLFVGSLVDSFGRYKPSNAALLVFSIASILIPLLPNLYLLLLLRIVQGVTTAFILVAKRAYFMDSYSGNQLKHYTSLFFIIWATAPIVAPFFGGYLQHLVGWEANFYFLGLLTLTILALTLKYGGETLKEFQPLKLHSLLRVYTSVITAKDFVFSLLILGLSYGMVLLFAMASPFIIEHDLHRTPLVTGYCALFSGVALMMGGIISKLLIARPLAGKIGFALGIQLVSAAAASVISSLNVTNIYAMMSFVVIQHLLVGFVFNNFYGYCLGRFSTNAGVVAGMTGGAFYIIASLSSYGTVRLLAVKNQASLALAYLFLNVCVLMFYSLFRKETSAALKKFRYELS